MTSRRLGGANGRNAWRGWCPPGLMGLGVGGSAEKAMLMAKESLFEPINMTESLDRGPQTPEEELRVSSMKKSTRLGLAPKGLGE